MADACLDIAEQVARVIRSNEEAQKFIAEQRTLTAGAAKPERDRVLAPWQIVAATAAATAALIGGTVAVAKLFLPKLFLPKLFLRFDRLWENGARSTGVGMESRDPGPYHRRSVRDPWASRLPRLSGDRLGTWRSD